MSFSASAPGSLMLLGEYAVLQGKRALVCAVDKRMTVVITPRIDQKIIITSALGSHETTTARIAIAEPFKFILAVLKKYRHQLATGCDVNVVTEFSHQVGFASSAAVTVAALAALFQWLNYSYEKLELVKIARSIVRQVQGLGSGADVAACVFGGVVEYRARPLQVKKIAQHFPLTVVYSGGKTPTAVAVKQVQNYFSALSPLFRQICCAIDCCVAQASAAIAQKNWVELGKLFNIQQGLMVALGVNTETLGDIIQNLLKQPDILGAKISGSGLGDCVIGLGQCVDHLPNEIPVMMTDQGVACEKS